MHTMFFSPFTVPLGAFAVAIVAIVAGTWTKANSRRVRGEQRLGMIARGVPLAEIEAVLRADDAREQDEGAADPWRRMRNARTTAIVLVASGLGICGAFLWMAHILQQRGLMLPAAIGIIPLLLGMGFAVDYFAQGRDLARFTADEETLKLSR